MTDPEGPAPTGPARRARAALPVLVVVLAAVVCALWVAPRTASSGDVLFGRVTVTGGAPGGSTRLVVPPVGSLQARTHAGPVGVSVHLDEVDLDRLGASSGDSLEPGTLTPRARDGVESLVRTWAWRTALLAALLGAVCGAVVASTTRPRRTARLVAVGLVTAVVAWGAAAGLAAATFDPGALERPQYHGALRHAPKVLAAVAGATDGWVTVRNSAGRVGEQLEALARTTSAGPDPASRPGDVVLLHVSDLHLNPLGMELTRRLVDAFDPAAVLDTGDLTSFGATPSEGLFAELADVGVPYYLVPGNHDSAAAVAAASSTGRVTVLDGRTVDVDGLAVAGLADPTSTEVGDRDPKDRTDRAYRAQWPTLRRLATSGRVDLVAVHNPSQAAALSGLDVAVAAGHVHHFDAARSAGTRLAVVGSTGAGGLGSLAGQDPQPYRAQLLRFRKVDGRYELWAVDRIEMSAEALLETGPGTFGVERTDPSRAAPGRYLGGDPRFDPEPPLPTTGPTTAPAAPAAPANPGAPTDASTPTSGGPGRR